MSELIEKLSSCSTSEQLRKVVIELDDRHRPELNTNSWMFSYHGEAFEFIRHGGYLLSRG